MRTYKVGDVVTCYGETSCLVNQGYGFHNTYTIKSIPKGKQMEKPNEFKSDREMMEWMMAGETAYYVGNANSTRCIDSEGAMRDEEGRRSGYNQHENYQRYPQRSIIFDGKTINLSEESYQELKRSLE